MLDETEIAYNLIKYLIENYKENIVQKYKIEEIDHIIGDNKLEQNEKIVMIMEKIGKNRGAIIKGGQIDLVKTSNIILDDFKNGRIGKITLEKAKGEKIGRDNK